MTRRALEIVHEMAKEHFLRCGFVHKCPADTREALNIVEDFIVNEFGEDEENG
jgi:hypothetical protein